jgi:prepilin-type N-terminal cleavage/methylation domain-containing protein
MNRISLRSERGLTLGEMLVALLVFSVVMAGALAFLRAQGRSFQLANQRVGMFQNSRYALNEMEKDMRTAGAAAPDIQPQLIYLGASVAAFNANYWTDVANDPKAVYYNPDAAPGTVTAMMKADRITIPLTSFAYPDTNYLVGVVNSDAETIIFYFEPDTSTTRSDDYVLRRQINNLPPDVVARNILQTPATPFFQYFRHTAVVGGGLTLQQVPNATLPLMHTRPIHLALNDTGAFALIDSVRAVLVNFTITNGLTGSAERRRAMTRLIRLPNAGLANKKTCGDQPILGVGLNAVYQALPTGEPSVRLTWAKATDESGGEKDVERYVLYRRPWNDPDWGDPYLSIPAGQPNYLYVDAAVASGDRYFYGLMAQDCTPALSTLASSVQVNIP